MNLRAHFRELMSKHGPKAVSAGLEKALGDIAKARRANGQPDKADSYEGLARIQESVTSAAFSTEQVEYRNRKKVTS